MISIIFELGDILVVVVVVVLYNWIPCKNKRPPNEKSEPTNTRLLKLASSFTNNLDVVDISVINALPPVPVNCVPLINKRPPNDRSEPTNTRLLKLAS